MKAKAAPRYAKLSSGGNRDFMCSAMSTVIRHKANNSHSVRQCVNSRGDGAPSRPPIRLRLDGEVNGRSK
jgi:hypothetical protein